jgi:hypothetical protein
MERMLMADLGPTIDGWAAQIDGDIVCIATPRVVDDMATRRRVRGLVKRAGGDCSTCGRCIIGRD